MVFVCVTDNQNQILNEVLDEIKINVVFSEKTIMKILNKDTAKNFVVK
jgi:hypothetical protein